MYISYNISLSKYSKLKCFFFIGKNMQESNVYRKVSKIDRQICVATECNKKKKYLKHLVAT